MTTTDSGGQFKTFPSIAMTLFEVPEPAGIDGKFVYNYFLADERESENTMASWQSFNRHGRKYARQVELEFLPVSAVIPDDAALSEIQMSDREKSRLLRRYKKKITRETDFGNRKFMSIQLQDHNASSGLLASVEATLLQKKIDTYALSPLETVLKYASETTENVDGQEILDSVNVDDANEYVSIDPTTGRPFEVSKAGDVNKLTFNMVVSERFVGDIASAAIQTPLSPSATIFAGTAKELVNLQAQSRKSQSSRTISVRDFVETYRPIQQEKIGIDDVFLGGNTVMGYHIRRSRTDRPNKIKDIFITNTNAERWIDTRVTYGVQYNYSISVVYLVRLFAYRGGEVIAADILVESRESPSINILCTEAVPPVAPDALRFYILQKEGLVIEWDFPFNPTEDIKRFQIFRRKSINHPFVLIGELDFDDSTILTERSEHIHEFLTKKLDAPRVYFSDLDFTVDSDYIYAVCSVDAHDLSSPYSEQFRVRFDKFEAKLQVDFISEKNAPKPYPNFVLRSQLTEDCIRDSNHSSLYCYFDPEYLNVVNSSREDLDFLQKSRREVSYKLQLMHLNFQQSVVADINVK